jgi:maltose alpha-D-glucosyltransferase/alpha-amylase
MSQTDWYKDVIIYQTHVRAFQDSNADGIGDFRGLMQRLDYLQGLGIDCLWLLPFYPSPLKDDGYDIADYYGVHPDYGTLEDFRAFLEEAHRRGIRVITELVLNHTSDQHAWFQAARRDPASPYRDYYVWSDTDERYRQARVIFLDTEISNWTWDPVAKAYYWHRFFSHQPDLNYDNPRVQEEMLRVIAFWLDLGVDGLRCDAVPYLFEREGTACENLPETHAYMKRVRRFVDERYAGTRLLLAEANQWPEDVIAYFGEGDEFHMAFHFPLMPRMFMAIRQEDRHPITEILRRTPEIPPTCQWALFLRNHDELTLEMVTDEERDYMYQEYARDPKMRLNLGIRRRLAPLLDNSRRRIELLTSLLFSLPGTPIVYYGDEIGMGDNIYLGDRNGVRTPMQWSADRNAGFSRADPERLYLPLIENPLYHYMTVNVEAQERTPASLLNWMKRLIAIRKRFPVFGRGRLELLSPANRRVLAYLRIHDGETILCVANLSRFVQPCELDLRRYDGWTPVELFGTTPFPRIGQLPYFLTLGPHSFYWFRLLPPEAAPRGAVAQP